MPKEMAQLLKSMHYRCTVLAEKPSLVPSTHLGWVTTAYITPGPGDLTASFVL